MPAHDPVFGVTKNLAGNWMYQDQQVERILDNAAYTFAHPDNTLVLAGPPRKITVAADQMSGFDSLIAIGVLQQIGITQTKPTQPFMSIGSGRSYFLSGKAAGQIQVARFMCNGRNLLRVLFHNAVEAGLDVSQFDDPAVDNINANGNYQFFTNLDSELYLIPMGLALVFHDKAHNPVGGLYAELCMVTSWGVTVAAGQSFIMENVTIVFDRLLPYDGSLGSKKTVGQEAMDKAIAGDKYLGWINNGEYEISSTSDKLE